jgi:MFS family permease
MKALGMWGGIAGLGGTSGTVISGALVDLASWRWIFFVNLPVALFALVMVPRLTSESRMVRDGRRPDFAGAITGTAGSSRSSTDCCKRRITRGDRPRFCYRCSAGLPCSA